MNSDSGRVLLVGGGGYIGSHTARECRRAGIEPVIFDNYSTGNPESVDGFEEIRGDLLEPRSIRSAFEHFQFDAVFHFAALSEVGESTNNPAAYYRNNVAGTLNLLQAMIDSGVSRLIFSSTAAVYGDPIEIPIPENHATQPVNPYGRSKLMVEQILADIAACHDVRYMSLRYFNAAGADAVGDIGEDHRDESHLVPRLLLTALGRCDEFAVFGSDYDTPDGTCIRDFIHVTDIARAHILALQNLDEWPNEVVNLGSSEGYSVREVVEEAQAVADLPIRIREAERREGDPAVLVASNDKARAVLGWRPECSELRTILATAWNWHKRHPGGFRARRSDHAEPTSKSTELFGDIAVRLGYASDEDVARALERQAEELERGNEHKLLGMHMLEMGFLSTSELIEILRVYEQR